MLDVVQRSQYVQDLDALCLRDQSAKNTVCLLLKSLLPGVNPLLSSSGSSPAHHRPAFETQRGANTFPSVCGLTTTNFTDPSASHSNARAGGRSTLSSLRWRTLSRLRAEENDQPVTQSIATPEPSSRTIPTLDRTLVAR